MKKILIILFVALSVSSCSTVRQKSVLGSVYSQTETKNYQSRKFDTNDKDSVLRAVIATMQDLGFIIDSADEGLGVVSGTSFKNDSKLTVSVRPFEEKQMLVRASAQTKKKELKEPVAYQNFFDSLSRVLSVEVHEIE